MLFKKNENLSVKFLKCLCRIKGWDYHDKIETEKKQEIRKFISDYVFKNIYDETFQEKISYNRLNFLIEFPTIKPTIRAILLLLELSNDEKEFNEHYQKMTE